MKDHIVKHIRDKNDNPYATLVAYKDGNDVYLGYSKCNTKYDTFKKSMGRNIALSRAKKSKEKLEYVRSVRWGLFPREEDIEKRLNHRGLKDVSIREIRSEDIFNFSQRCKKYFKVNEIIVVPIHCKTTTPIIKYIKI